MGEKDFWLKIGLIVMLVALSITFIYPPQDKLKPGIDLGGGHSLLFEIDDSGNDGRTDLAERVMEILKQRVDPGGTRNLIWRPIGRNRLEIQMPQPPREQRETREKYEQAREAIAATQITRAQILNAVDLPPEQRQDAIDRLVGEVDSRRPLFEKLVTTVDEYRELSGPATTQPSTRPVDTETAQKLDKLFVQRNETIDKLLATNVSPEVLGDLLDLDRTSEVRQNRLAEMKADHPDMVPLIDNMIAAHEEWSKQKGYLSDPSDLMRLLRGAGELEFRIMAERDSSTGRLFSSNPEYQESAEKYIEQLSKLGPRRQDGDNYQWFEIAKPEQSDIPDNPNFVVSEYLGKKYVLAHATEDMGLLHDSKSSWKLRRAYPQRDRTGAPAVGFELNARGGEIFGRLTKENIKRPLGIFLDDKVFSAPTIQSQITTQGQISGGAGGFSPQEVATLVNTLEAGVLPARLKEMPLQEKSVGPGLGATNRTKGVTATAIALLITLAFMAVYYTYSGFIANIALIMNFVITLGVMSFLGNTFTLPGIAGLILTLGMAVDANVLIYERIREELERGVSVRMAVRLGYEKAFSAILDSNVTTILTATILAYLGSEEIKGFGQTLGIGLCISMFTALFVTRQYFHIMLPPTLDQTEMRKTWIATGVVALLAGAFLGTGWLVHRGSGMLEESALWGLGTFLAIVFGTAIIILGAMWLFRGIYKATGHQRANRLPILKLLSRPKIDWMGKRRIFWTVSACAVLGGLFIAWEELEFDTSNMLDIEFIGGTSVQVEVTDPDMTDEQLLDYIVGDDLDNPAKSVGWLRQAAADLSGAEVDRLGDNQYRIVPSGDYTNSQLEALMTPEFEDFTPLGGIQAADGAVTVTVMADAPRAPKDVDGIKALLARTGDYLRSAAENMRNLRVQIVREERAGQETQNAFEIITTETNKRIVSEAMLVSTGDILKVTQSIDASLYGRDDASINNGLFPIMQGDNTIGDVIGTDLAGNLAQTGVGDYKGGVMMVFEDLQPAATAGEIEQRLKDMRLQPDFDAALRPFDVFGLEAVNPGAPQDERRYEKVAIAVVDRNTPYTEDGQNESWQEQVAEKEYRIAQAAFETSRSLQRVTQFAPQIAGEAAMKAIIAVIISLIVIAGYLWVRFGSVDYGLAGIVALYHDTAIALSAVALSHLLHDTWFGHLIGLRDIRIDLSVIAALLTIIGFSINDTIVIFDRIRENRGRLATISGELINRSINETFSRTIITTLTTFMVVLVMYFFGGAGIHAFAFTMVVGCISGTYSTIAVATPMVNNPRALWTVSIVLAALTAIGLVTTIGVMWLKTVLIVVVIALAAYGLYRMVGMQPTRREAAPAA